MLILDMFGGQDAPPYFEGKLMMAPRKIDFETLVPSYPIYLSGPHIYVKSWIHHGYYGNKKIIILSTS